MRAMWRRMAAVLSAVGLACLALVAGTPTAVASTTSPCGALASSYNPLNPPVYSHVVVLMEENWSYRDFVRSTKTPFLTGLTHTCGNETNFHNATHSSQPNYMAATSGVASGIGVRVANDNVFHQVQTTGRTWRSFEESMAAPCSGREINAYKPGHNPAFFYNDLRSPQNTCLSNDVPSSPALDAAIATDSLPTYSWISPNMCHDFHWAPVCGSNSSARFAQGDAWLAALIPRLTALPSYVAGQTLIVVTFDEGQGGTAGVDCTKPSYYVNHPDCQIATVVLSPYIAPGTADSSSQNLYSLLATTEDILGLPRLGRAVGQPSMRTALKF
jgi:phospholipase C